MFNFDKETEFIFELIAKNAYNTGVCAYFVGGMVRDALMGIEIKDIDILIEGSAIDFVKNLKENFLDRLNITVKSTHKAFDTSKTVIDGIDIDFASTREENYPFPGCLPVVKNTGCPVKDDLKRRDFTVNAIASRLLFKDGKLSYEIIDPFNGTADIKQKKLKILHNKSYIDDPTRILRGLDFSLRFNFNFTSEDNRLIKSALNSPNRDGLSVDRVKLTLKKLFSSTRFSDALFSILENEYYKIWADTLPFTNKTAKNLINAVRVFNVPAESLFLEALFNIPVKDTGILRENPKPSNFEIYNFYKNHKPLDLALQYAFFDDKGAEFYYKKLKNIKPGVTGKTLLKAGFKEGKEIGEEISRLLKEKLNSLPPFSN